MSALWYNIFMFTDTHSHIHFSKEFPDVEDILIRAQKKAVSRQIIVGCTVKDSYEALDFVKNHGQFSLWSTLGVHPHNADEWNDDTRKKFLSTVEKEKKVVALGELGLDYFRNFKPKDVQLKAFSEQLALAKALDLPVVVHVRDAWDDAMKGLKAAGNTKVILHCFTGTEEYAAICNDRGYHLSFSGVLTYPKNAYLREIASKLPSELLLIETDCPYLTPQVFRGKRNEPAFVVETAKVLAEVRGVTLDEVGEQTTANAVRLFAIS